MRIHLNIQANNTLIPFDHQHLLVGTIHKWLGRNDEHGKVSLYSFSRLEGGRREKVNLRFQRECNFFFSSFYPNLIKQAIEGIQKDPSMFHGLFVNEVTIQNDPDLSDRTLFHVASPILIKRKTENRIEHILYTDERANECLCETLNTRMNEANIPFDDGLKIQFDHFYLKAGTKKITYHGIENKANWCPVIIEGKPETKLFAWNVGLGNSTGIGFGAIK